MFGQIIAVLLSLASFILAPRRPEADGAQGRHRQGRARRRLCLGLLQMTGLIAQFLGPLGDMLALMAFVAAWYQVCAWSMAPTPVAPSCSCSCTCSSSCSAPPCSPSSSNPARFRGGGAAELHSFAPPARRML